MRSSSNKSSVLKTIFAAVQEHQHDLTRIDIRQSIIILAVPMILEMMMESFFAVVDIFFVGRLGEHAIATVGLTEAAIMIVYSVGVGLSMAGTALIARRFGEKEYSKAGTAAFQLLSFGIFISIIIGATGFVFSGNILVLMGAQNEVLAFGENYTKIIFAGNTAIMLLFLINGAFRGAGQAHLAMKTLFISNGLNIVLDPLLIFGLGDIFPGLGLAGAAWATTIGRSFGVCYQLYHLFNGKHLLKITRSNLIIKVKLIKKIISIAAGGMGQFLIDSAAWIALTRMAAEFGSVTVASFTIAFRILLFSLMPAWGLSAAASTLVGQNLGAGKILRAEISTLLTARYNVVFLAGVTVIYLLAGTYIAGWFSIVPEVANLSGKGLKIISLGYVFFAVGMVMIQAFNGAGDTKTPTLINIAVLCCVEIPMAYILAFYTPLKETGIFLSIAICHSLHAVVAYYFFKQGKWKKNIV
ncbi:MAG: MATE family efflux transporter [Cytophagaceae bacterium]